MLEQAKFIDIPTKYYPRGLELVGSSFEGADVLDFGCGRGIVTLGIAAHCSPASVTGVEISDDFALATGFLESGEVSLPDASQVTFKKIEPFGFLGTAKYDVAVSWSVLEHVDRRFLGRQLQLIAEALRPGGACVFQVAPLFYSAEGHHLFGLLPDWGHLYMMEQEIVEILSDRAEPGVADALLSMYRSLNRGTIEDFEAAFLSAGLEVVDRYETHRREGLPEALPRVFREEVLVTEQSVWSLRKPA